MRRLNQSYTYLEIGSHLGGSLLPHLADSRCGHAISIDPRPASFPDERGGAVTYEMNSTQRMIEGLRAHLSGDVFGKLQTFDLDAIDVPPAEIAQKVDLAFIDGEHTNTAAFSDSLSILPMLADDAILAYHDSNLVVDAIRNVERFLVYANIPFELAFLPDNVAAIGLRKTGSALLAEVGSAALNREQFFAHARQTVQGHVAKEVLQRGDLGLSLSVNYALKAFVRKRVDR